MAKNFPANCEVGGFILLPKGPGSMPKEEARNKRGGPEHPHEARPTPYRPIVVVGLFIKSQRDQLLFQMIAHATGLFR